MARAARREALAVLRKQREIPTPDTDPLDDRQAPPWQGLLAEERDSELRRAFQRLPARCQTLLRLLILEPAPSYAAAAAALDIPIGSLGPTRARCLATLRRHMSVYTADEGGPNAN